MIEENKISKIADLSRNRPDFRELFEILSLWQRNQRSIDLDDFVRRFKDENIASELEQRKLSIEFFKKLDACGVGNFLVGRRGKSTRFIWRDAMLDVAQIALDKETTQNNLPEQVERTTNIDNLSDQKDHSKTTFSHKYILRQNYEVTLNLPVDLTETEAERLSNFIKTLPFKE